MRFFTSDTHFRHANIIQYDSRPFSSVEEMNETIIETWNMTVSKRDTVYHLGDIGFGSPAVMWPIIQRLNGRRILVRGNHDLFNGYTARRCAMVHPEMFHDICDIDTTRIGEYNVVMSHYPYEDQRFAERAPRMLGDWLIHGHTHKMTPRVVCGPGGRKMINVSCCHWDYAPVPETTILHLIRENGG